jgi:hypothetical protein
MSTATCIQNSKIESPLIQMTQAYTTLTHLHDDAPIFIDGVEEFEVEKNLNSRICQGNLEYLIHWGGYSYEENTWEPERNVKNSHP